MKEQGNGVCILRIENKKSVTEYYDAAVVATYGNLELLNEVDIERPKLKFEVCEIVNVLPPKVLKDSSITIIDGPFWSLTPWPGFGNYALTHVRYTPTASFNSYRQASEFKNKGHIESNFLLMQKDLVTYHNIFSQVEKIKSFFAIKCLIPEKETTDARPIIYKFNKKGSVLLIIGGKIDNVYDLNQVLDQFTSNIGVIN
jgi:hypothetical protein